MLLTTSRHGRCLTANCQRAFSTFYPLYQETRPPTAPKQTPDLKTIRSDPELFERNAILRNYKDHAKSPNRIAELLQEVKTLSNSLSEPRKQIKKLEKELGRVRGINDDEAVSNVLGLIKPLRHTIDELEPLQTANTELAQSLALALPNLTSSETPTDGEFKLINYINYDSSNPPQYGKGADHSLIGQQLGLLDFSSASATTGWGFYYLLNEAALLEQALIQYALSVAMKRGWRIVSPPSLVYSHVADSCGFQPRDANDEQQIWQVAQPARDAGKPKRSLAATAEIPLAALHANHDIPEHDLPIKLIGSSRCYRAEAGARGVDTKGLYRVHEFTKVEMFAWTDCPSTSQGLPDESEWTKKSTEVFNEMVEIQTEILSSLGLPCRVLEMPSSDLGASAFRKIDIEALFPSRMNRDDGWGELTSVSICTDYQSRRLNTRILQDSGAKAKFPHTVNGTATAVPRVLACLLENGWREKEGCVIIPEVLRPYMGGMSQIGPK